MKSSYWLCLNKKFWLLLYNYFMVWSKSVKVCDLSLNHTLFYDWLKIILNSPLLRRPDNYFDELIILIPGLDEKSNKIQLVEEKIRKSTNGKIIRRSVLTKNVMDLCKKNNLDLFIGSAWSIKTPNKVIILSWTLKVKDGKNFIIQERKD